MSDTGRNDNVVRLGPGGDVVKALEQMLEQAKAGEWDACLLLGYNSKTGDNVRMWRGEMRLFTALGMLEAAKVATLADVEWETVKT